VISIRELAARFARFAGIGSYTLEAMTPEALAEAAEVDTLMAELPEMQYLFQRPFVLGSAETEATFGLAPSSPDDANRAIATAMSARPSRRRAADRMRTFPARLRLGGTTPPTWLIDRFLESYVLWRERSAEVAITYQSWARAAHTDRGAAFAAYRTALDREATQRACTSNTQSASPRRPHPAANDTPRSHTTATASWR
jgi:hypothetical protein